MGAISFSDEQTWVKAAWVVSRLIADMEYRCPNDEKLRTTLRVAKGISGINVDLLDVEDQDAFTELLRNTIELTVADPQVETLRWKKGLDALSQVQYIDALRELLLIIPHRRP